MLKTIVLAFLLIPAVGGAAVDYDRKDALQASQAVIGSSIGDYTLRDVTGQAFKLTALRGEPLTLAGRRVGPSPDEGRPLGSHFPSLNRDSG